VSFSSNNGADAGDSVLAQGITYMVRVCESCNRIAPPEADESCPWGHCDGALVEIEVIPLAIAKRWRRDHAVADQKIEAINGELAGAFGDGASSGPERRSAVVRRFVT
jgi:hypothetical protein